MGRVWGTGWGREGTFARFFTSFALPPNRRVERVSVTSDSAGEQQQISVVLQLPPIDSCISEELWDLGWGLRWGLGLGSGMGSEVGSGVGVCDGI